MNIDEVINRAIERSIVYNVMNTNTYFNQPPVGGYQLTDDNEYIFNYREDLSSLIFLEVVTRFGSPGSDSFNESYKELRRQRIKGLSKYKKIKENDSLLTNQCPICIEDFCVCEYQRTLECGHSFHKKCIDKWFKKDKDDCPMCRTKVINI